MISRKGAKNAETRRRKERITAAAAVIIAYFPLRLGALGGFA
jgi:hypothetical protein